MVNVSLQDDLVVFDVQGLDQLWAFKSRLEIPLKNILGARVDPSVATGWWKGTRAPGTHIPEVIVAGTFYRDGKRIFWDVKDPERTIVVALADERYDELIVEVEDPGAVVARLERAREAAAG